MNTPLNPHLYKMLKTSAEADKAKAMLTLNLLLIKTLNLILKCQTLLDKWKKNTQL